MFFDLGILKSGKKIFNNQCSINNAQVYGSCLKYGKE